MLHCARLLAPFAAGLVALCLGVPAQAAKRVALVIGNAAYERAGPLANPGNDARDIAQALTDLGFETILGLDLSKRDFDGKVRDFSRALSGADAALLFYAGHGLQVAGRNHLVPIDAQLQSERDLDFEAVSLDFVLRQMELGREGKTNIVILDACRDNPLARNLARSMGTRSAGVGQGLAQVQTGVGTFIAYSTQPGNVALDGAERNSPFTTAFVKALREPARPLNALMTEVRKGVLTATAGRQVPWDHSSLVEDFYFRAAAPGSIPPRPTPADGDAAAMQERLRKLETELARKTDQDQTVRLVEITNLKERVRRLEADNKADQQRIFDVYRKAGAADDRASISREVGAIQVQMARRSQELRSLRDNIGRLEADAGIAPPAEGTARN
ncbi:MAG: caspase family protein [Hyphomicrobiaceae bacterium]|nr:caspase family protein [Hyphomicrobiaceae bacterium]